MGISAVGQHVPLPQGTDSIQQVTTTADQVAKTSGKPHHHKHHKGGAVPPTASLATDTAQISDKAKELAAQLTATSGTEEVKESPSAKAAEQAGSGLPVQP